MSGYSRAPAAGFDNDIDQLHKRVRFDKVSYNVYAVYIRLNSLGLGSVEGSGRTPGPTIIPTRPTT
jgi:hypothetical protein